MPRRLLGELLVEEGIVTEGGLRGILTVQKRKLESTKDTGGTDDALRARLKDKPLSASTCASRAR
jgi:hypothetical protein